MKKRERAFNYNLADVIDILAILRIKNDQLPGEFSGVLKEAVEDLDLILSRGRYKNPSKILRSAAAIAQANLMVWMFKDKLKPEHPEYEKVLSRCQLLNDVRNDNKNKIMAASGELTPARSKSIFFLKKATK